MGKKQGRKIQVKRQAWEVMAEGAAKKIGVSPAEMKRETRAAIIRAVADKIAAKVMIKRPEQESREPKEPAEGDSLFEDLIRQAGSFLPQDRG